MFDRLTMTVVVAVRSLLILEAGPSLHKMETESTENQCVQETLRSVVGLQQLRIN